MVKNTNIKFLLLFIIFFLILFYMYFYVINEKFDNITTTTTTQSIILSTQIQNQIALLIGIAPSRILNLTYTGDISKNQLVVLFDVLEASTIDKINNQLTKQEALDKATQLFDTNNFIISINGSNITLNKDRNFNKTIGNTNKSTYFDNKGLLDVANYARSIYKTIPENTDLTKYYKLTINSNYNIVPII